MDDRTMLELAAKAAGLYTADDISDCWTDTNTGEEGEPLYPPFGFVALSGVWNPLLDDGDALRLAVKLQIDFQFEDGNVVTWFSCPRQGWDNGQVWSWEESLGDDSLSATRRAITRAAAEIQLAKESGK